MKSKNTTIAIVLALLVGFPLSSYLYLRKGMNFRLDAIAALQVKGHLLLPSDVEIPAPAALLIYRSSQKVSESLEVVKAHFSDRGDIAYTDIKDYSRSAIDSLNVAEERCSLDGSQPDIFLANRRNEIVNCYRSNDELEMTDLVEHIAFLVPPDPEKDFEFKRSREK